MTTSWLSEFPGLAWGIDVVRSQFKAINTWEFSHLGKDTSRLLKDAHFRKQTICREDFPLVSEFWDMLLARQAAGVTFRIVAAPEEPLILQGWPDLSSPTGYCGVLKPAILPEAFTVNGITATCQMALGTVEYPVFVLNMCTGKIIVTNNAANILFGIDVALNNQGIKLDDIVSGVLKDKFLSAVNHAIHHDVWAGTLILHNMKNNFFSSRVRISSCCLSSQDKIVRVALLNTKIKQYNSYLTHDSFIKKHNGSLKKDLNRLLKDFQPYIDGLMLSIIRSHHGEVDVYGVGNCFSDLSWGATHAYEGTIAQDIERFGLKSLVVEDTLDSIKSIDWVLFIPHGVRSYFARPCYEHGELHAVLIIVSQKPGHFPPDAGDQLQKLLDIFEKIALRYRKGKSIKAE